MTGQTSAMMALRDPDIRLMLKVRADDREAFAELVERFQHRLVGIMNHLVGHSQEAEDLAQEVFLRVYKTRHRYSPKAKFSTWLFTIANNLALNVAADDAPPPNHRLQQEELAGVIRKALEDLNERQRVAVVLNKFEDMGYGEIADVMGLSAKAVKSLLSRARTKLREALRSYIAPDGDLPPDEPGENSDAEE